LQLQHCSLPDPPKVQLQPCFDSFDLPVLLNEVGHAGERPDDVPPSFVDVRTRRVGHVAERHSMVSQRPDCSRLPFGPLEAYLWAQARLIGDCPWDEVHGVAADGKPLAVWAEVGEMAVQAGLQSASVWGRPENGQWNRRQPVELGESLRQVSCATDLHSVAVRRAQDVNNLSHANSFQGRRVRARPGVAGPDGFGGCSLTVSSVAW